MSNTYNAVVPSLNNDAFWSLRDKITEIIVDGHHELIPEIESDFSKYADTDKQYEVVDSLLKQFSESNLKEDVKYALVEKLKNNIECKKRPTQTIQEFVDSYDLEKLENAYYQNTVISLCERTMGFINKSHECSTTDELIQYYVNKVAEMKEKCPELMENYKISTFEDEVKSVVDKDVFERLFCLPCISACAKITQPVEGHENVLEDEYSLELSSTYNYHTGSINVIVEPSFHRSDLTVMRSAS